MSLASRRDERHNKLGNRLLDCLLPFKRVPEVNLGDVDLKQMACSTGISTITVQGLRVKEGLGWVLFRAVLSQKTHNLALLDSVNIIQLNATD